MTLLPDISVLIVNFNGMDVLPACLESIGPAAAGLRSEIVVVDNGSTDGSPAWLVSRADVRLIQGPANLGFAHAMNLARSAASGRVHLWLNPDCRLEPGSLEGAVRHLDSQGRPAIVGPMLVSSAGERQPSALSFTTPTSVLLHVLGVRGLAKVGWIRGALARVWGGKGGPIGTYVSTRFAGAEPRRVDWVTGACLLVSAESSRAAGPLDEDFFMYSEDEAWCRRAAAAGIECRWLPAWRAFHEVGGSGGRSPFIRCHYYRSMWLYQKKFSGLSRSVAGAALLAFFLAHALGESASRMAGAGPRGARPGLWLGLAGWLLGFNVRACGPVPPPAWPPVERSHA